MKIQAAHDREPPGTWERSSPKAALIMTGSQLSFPQFPFQDVVPQGKGRRALGIAVAQLKFQGIGFWEQRKALGDIPTGKGYQTGPTLVSETHWPGARWGGNLSWDVWATAKLKAMPHGQWGRPQLAQASWKPEWSRLRMESRRRLFQMRPSSGKTLPGRPQPQGASRCTADLVSLRSLAELTHQDAGCGGHPRLHH